jgi:hypothetical protein
VGVATWKSRAMKNISNMNEGEYFQAAADAMQSPENETLEYLCDLMKSASEAEATMIGNLIDDFPFISIN